MQEIWHFGTPLGATFSVIHFRKLFSGTTSPSQIACLYLEPFKSNRASNLTTLKKSPQKFNVFGIIADTRSGWLPPRAIHTAIILSNFQQPRVPGRSSNEKYVLSNSQSIQCNFFIFDHVTFVHFKICCCVQNSMKIRWFFTEISRYNDFQNGGRPPSWNCFTTILDHPRSLCCWPQLLVKFNVNVI